MNGNTNRKMKNNILIDYENVQPNGLTALQNMPDQTFRIILFVGANQSKVPIGLVSSMHSFGDKAEYVWVSDSGKNVLDFYIACYIGILIERDREAYFHIISRDTGYDSLIKYWKDKKINIARRKDLFDIPWLSSMIKESIDEKFDTVMKNLSESASSRPCKVKTLKNAINSQFGNQLNQKEIDGLVKRLEKQEYIVINKETERVSYQNMG